MQRNLLSRLCRNGSFYIFSALLLVIGIPCLQIFILAPTGFSDALNDVGNRQAGYLTWIHTHPTLFLSYRALLLAAFALLWTLPFSLFRIIVAQEIMVQQEIATESEQDETDSASDSDEEYEDSEEAEEETEANDKTEDQQKDGMPPFAWRGKGFLVLAAWTGIIGIGFYLLSSLAGTFYLLTQSNINTASPWPGLFTLGTTGIGSGLIGVSTLFSGAMICRTGTRFWPTSWVVFGYAALIVGALTCLSAVAVACTPGSSQSTLTTIATLLSGIWYAWLGILLVKLKPES